MTDPEPGNRIEQLNQLAHDLNHCLHVIGLATEILKECRTNKTEFDRICTSLETERRQAAELVQQLLTTAREPG